MRSLFLVLSFLWTQIALADHVFVPLPEESGVPTYASAGVLPSTGIGDGSVGVTLDTHSFYIYNLGTTTWVLSGGGSGLTGPGVSVNNEIMLWSGTSGTVAKRATGTGVVHATSGVFSVANVNLASEVTGTTPIANGGSGQTSASAAFNAFSPMTTAGDLIYGGASGAGTRLAAGTSTQVLHGGATPSWGSVSLTTGVTGTLPIANGGTGQTTAGAAFNALDPLTTKGDLITHDGTNSVRQAVGSNGQVLVADSAQTNGIKFQSMPFPTRAKMFHCDSIVLTGNGLVFNLDPNSLYNGNCFQDTSANADSFTSSFFLAAGTYNFEVLGTTAPNRPIVDWYVDGVIKVTGQDWYTAGIVPNVRKSNSITVTGNGQHILKGIVNGKNGSSSDFNLAIGTMDFRLATDTTNTVN